MCRVTSGDDVQKLMSLPAQGYRVAGKFLDTRRAGAVHTSCPHGWHTELCHHRESKWQALQRRSLWQKRPCITSRSLIRIQAGSCDRGAQERLRPLALQRHFSVSTKFAHVESRLSSRKRQGGVVFYTPANLCDRRACSASVAVGVIDGGLGDRCSQRRACRRPPARARSARSVLAAASRPASTAAPDGFHRSRTTPRSTTRRGCQVKCVTFFTPALAPQTESQTD